MINHPLYGRRILHILSPVRWVSHIWQHSADSNYRVAERIIKWLPMCHHYVLIPEKNDLLGKLGNGSQETTINNVTYIKFPYPSSVLMNRGHFAMTNFTHWLEPHIRELDFDYVFVHQPELLYNIKNALQVCRMGPALKTFIFFHWVDCRASKPVTEFPDGYFRQLEGIELADKVFFHGEEAIKYLKSNWKREQITTGFNDEYLKKKLVFMPLPSALIATKVNVVPFPLPKDKKILVFNHRWAHTTGIDKLIAYTEGLDREEYLIWITDREAIKPRAGTAAPDWMKIGSLGLGEYMYLLQHAFATLTFVDGYATWNMSVQDGLHFGTPGLIYKHSIMETIIGSNGNYPYFFKKKSEFVEKLELLNKERENFKWELPKHDEIFRQNLLNAMIDTMHVQSGEPSGVYDWLYHLLNLGKQGFKRHLLYNTHPELRAGNSFERIRAWCMGKGVKDDPMSKYTRLWIPQDKESEIKELIKGMAFKKTEKDPTFVFTNENFW